VGCCAPDNDAYVSLRDGNFSLRRSLKNHSLCDYIISPNAYKRLLGRWLSNKGVPPSKDRSGGTTTSAHVQGPGRTSSPLKGLMPVPGRGNRKLSFSGAASPPNLKLDLLTSPSPRSQKLDSASTTSPRSSRRPSNSSSLNPDQQRPRSQSLSPCRESDPLWTERALPVLPSAFARPLPVREYLHVVRADNLHEILTSRDYTTTTTSSRPAVSNNYTSQARTLSPRGRKYSQPMPPTFGLYASPRGRSSFSPCPARISLEISRGSSAS